ncbi:MAG TPA: hypothetical protein VHA57_11255 [Actinomycetota bacterium]|nr:hypothetical protein [Actinomycetota bacterium]
MLDLDLAERTEPFNSGDTAAVIEVLHGRIWTVRPVTVIKDAADEIALWLAPGQMTRYPSGRQHGRHTVALG